MPSQDGIFTRRFMKKFYAFFRSMAFGIILLGLITVCSVIGSLIPQNAEAMTYVRYYPDFYQIIFALQADHIFTSWYFIVLSALLCLNLTLCSVTRITSLLKNKPKAYENALHMKKQAQAADKEEVQAVREWLEKQHCRKEEKDGVTVYSRNDSVKGEPGTDSRVKWIRKLFGERILSAYRKSRQDWMGSSWKKSTQLSMPSYDAVWDAILTNRWPENLLPGAFVDWDNTPRNRNGVSYVGFSMEKFEHNMRALLHRAKSEKKPMVFINAWNEWGEGAYLEPDEHYGNARLETIRSIQNELNDHAV